MYQSCAHPQSEHPPFLTKGIGWCYQGGVDNISVNISINQNLSATQLITTTDNTLERHTRESMRARLSCAIAVFRVAGLGRCRKNTAH